MTKVFEIGQVVYVLAEKEQIILPGIVVEEVVVKKLTGNFVSWKVKIGTAEKAKLYDTSKINGEVYGDLDELRAAMFGNFENFLNDLCKDAHLKVEKWYGKEIAERQKPATPLDNLDKIDPDTMLSSLGESSEVATSAQPTHNKVIPRTEQEVRQELKNRFVDNSVGATEDDTKLFFVNPNGERVPLTR